MKKFLAILLILSMASLTCFAAKKPVVPTPEVDIKPLPNQYKKISIQGGYDTVASFNVRPVPVQAESFLIGMPFPLDDKSVLMGTSAPEGRKIATWSVLANNRFLIDIEAEIMHNYSEDKSTDVAYANGLGYRLHFDYSLSYNIGKVPHQITTGFTLHVPDSTVAKVVKFTDIDLLDGLEIDQNSLVGSAEGDIFFKFDLDSTNIITDTQHGYPSLKDGNYTANVTFTLKVKETK